MRIDRAFTGRANLFAEQAGILVVDKDGIDAEIAVQWNDGYNPQEFSFANNINTHEGGTHLSGFRAALTRAGIPVFAQFGLTPQTALKYGIPYSAQNSADALATAEASARLVEEAKMLEDAGAVVERWRRGGGGQDRNTITIAVDTSNAPGNLPW